MKIKRIELTIDTARFIIEESHPCAKPAGLRIRDDHGDYSTVINSGASEEEIWHIAHHMFTIGTGHRCTNGDVRGLQMMLSLSVP
jgi:hypothetical protein